MPGKHEADTFSERKIAERSMLETLGARRVEPISFMMVSNLSSHTSTSCD